MKEGIIWAILLFSMCVSENLVDAKEEISSIKNETIIKCEEEFDVYDLRHPGTEAAILTAMTHDDISISDIDYTFYLLKFANIQIMDEDAVLYKIFYKGDCVGYITNDFMQSGVVYYNSDPNNKEILYYSRKDSKRRFIRYDIQVEYTIINHLCEE